MSIIIKPQICDEPKEYNIYLYPNDKKTISLHNTLHESNICLNGNIHNLTLPVAGQTQDIKLIINSLIHSDEITMTSKLLLDSRINEIEIHKTLDNSLFVMIAPNIDEVQKKCSESAQFKSDISADVTKSTARCSLGQIAVVIDTNVSPIDSECDMVTRRFRRISEMDSSLLSDYDNMTLDNVDYINL